MQPDQRLYRGTRIPAAIEGLAVEGCRQSGEAPHGGVDAALPPCSRTLLFRKRFSLTMHAVERGMWLQLRPPRASARAGGGTRRGKGQDPEGRAAGEGSMLPVAMSCLTAPVRHGSPPLCRISAPSEV